MDKGTILMQALGRDMAMIGSYCSPLPTAIDLRLARLRLPPAWRPALVTAMRLGMGTGLGAAFGAAAGHAEFWASVGTGLGAALEAIARRS